MIHKYNIGDRVLFDGLVGIVESKSNYFDGKLCYGLVAEENQELSCTAPESALSLLGDEEEINQKERLDQAKYESNLIMRQIDSVTDKYIGDCSF